MKRLLTVALLAVPALALEPGQMAIPVDGKDLVIYQAAPIEKPVGGKAFHGSNFIHPLKTPSGFTVTDSQPGDHLHHFGLWWPWKFIEVEGRKILCWELQKGDGLIEAKKATPAPNGLITESNYLDRKSPDGPQIRLRETTRMTVSPLMDKPAHGYLLDLTITEQVAGEQPVTISTYHYSGFGFRGAPQWNKNTSTILTSEGKDRSGANATPARWVRVEGAADKGATAGVLLMSHPSNHAHPEKLRTWDQQHEGAIFINFNPVMDQPWTFEPGKDYTRHYRVFVYDGTLTVPEAEELWKSFAKG